MTVKTSTLLNQPEEIEDNLMPDNEQSNNIENNVDLNKLNALKTKAANKQQEEKKMSAKIIAKKERTLEWGVIGTGQCGSRLAEAFYKLGFPSICMNTALVDLKHISIPDSNKLLLDNSNGIGGASKELSIGHSAAEAYRGEILQLVNEKLGDTPANILCLSLGGGSGAGSCETLVELLSGLGKPLMVIAVLPMTVDDPLSKSNSLETLGKLSTFVRNKKIVNLIVVDNAKIESIYRDANQFDFFDLANKSIVETLDVFNTMSAQPSNVKAMDGMELCKVLFDGEGLSCFGHFKVSNYQEDTAIAESVVNNLSNNLLADGFDLKQAKYIGFILTANRSVWSKIPSSSINYASAMINDIGTPNGVFKGIYTVDDQEDCVNVYTIFSGLGLPESRIDGLKQETLTLQHKIKTKDDQRNLTLKMDTKNETISQADQIKQKIQQKSSSFGRFVGNNSVSDRRK
jgi:tubulin-like protein CetZ